jgi:hypothetical protein
LQGTDWAKASFIPGPAKKLKLAKTLLRRAFSRLRDFKAWNGFSRFADQDLV